MGSITGLLRGFISAAAETMDEVMGRAMTRVSSAYTANSATLPVETTYGWPSTGFFVVAGHRAAYTGTTATSFTGVSVGGATGIPEDLVAGALVVDDGQNRTLFDQLRNSIMLMRAALPEVKVIASNGYITLPQGIDLTTARELTRSMLWGPALTRRAIERALNALLGEGNFELYQRLETTPLTIYIGGLSASVSDSPIGRSYLVGAEEVTPNSTTELDTAKEPTTVYGVFLATDPYQTGTNYALRVVTVETRAADGAKLFGLVPGTWLPGDLGSWIWFVNSAGKAESWRVAEVVNDQEVILDQPIRDDGWVDVTGTDEIQTYDPYFAPWMVGHQLVLYDIDAGVYTIAEFITPTRVRLTGAALTVRSGGRYSLQPAFDDGFPAVNHSGRVQVSGTTVTLPRALPAGPPDVLVNYTTISSAQVLTNNSVDGNAQSPLYLFDLEQQISLILDQLVAAGVRYLFVE